MSRDLVHEEENIGYDKQYPNGSIKCKNFMFCKSVLPNWWYDRKGKYLCTNCDMLFGTWGNQIGKGILPIIKNAECPICLEIKTCISQPRCDHYTCIDCFKRCYYGENINEPPFPYPEIENEYYNHSDPDDPEWFIKYPLIQKYNDDFNALLDQKEEKMNSEYYLQQCPLCRK